jgi:phenylacetate-CoA ligase
MTPLPLTPLDPWIRSRLGLSPSRPFTREELRRRQLDRLRRTLADTARRSPFYRRRLSGRTDFTSLDFDEFHSLPFTNAEDLRRDPLELLCISQAEVARVVTLRSSGTSAPPKRLFFDRADLELTVDFFHHGMSTLVQPGQRVMILMPGEAPGSVGALLAEGLSRLGAVGSAHGPVRDPEQAVAAILAAKAACLVGIPVQILGLARHPGSARIPRGAIRSAVLSTDYVPATIVAALERRWGCEVFQHYGMSEMGYGGGLECAAHEGYHLREADLYVEIVDPESGASLPEGVSGEIVFTTLTRRAMPLIRYRTGDTARFLPQYCPCGSPLRRLSKVEGRRSNVAGIGPSLRLSMAALDEAIFSVPEILDFKAELIPANGAARLSLTVYGDPRFLNAVSAVKAAVTAIPSVREAIAGGGLKLDPVLLSPVDWSTLGACKRSLIDRRKEAAAP